jgi:prepilin-type N-terminal cleavage/methylation domain-containing protein
MKPLLRYPFTKRRRAPGFTLVEILVAIAVLGISVLILAQIFGTMNRVWLYGQGKVNNLTKARAMLNILEGDFQAAILRPDLAAFPSGAVEFYTACPGVPNTGTGPLRNISLVLYALKSGTTPTGLPTSTLERSDMPISWTDSATEIGFGDVTAFPTSSSTEPFTSRDTAPGVVAFQVLFVQSDGTLSTTTFTPALSVSGSANANPTRSIGVTLVVIDDQAMQLLNPAQVSAIQNGFASAVTGNPTVKADWENYLNTSFPWDKYPKNLGTGIGSYECYLSVP